MRFVGEAPELQEGVEILLEDGVHRGDLVVFEGREDGTVAIRLAGPDDEGPVYYVHPEGTAGELTFVRTSMRRLATHRENASASRTLWEETFSDVGFFYRDADLRDEVLEK